MACQSLLMGAVEACCAAETGPSNEGLNKLHQAEALDPVGLTDDLDMFAELHMKEIKEFKHSRLAMFSMLGYYVQALVPGHANYPPLTTQTCALCRLFCVLFLCPCFPCVACTVRGGEE